jgi:hypothetical protein
MTRLAGSIIDKFAGTVRNSKWFSNMLTSTFRQMLSLVGEPLAVYSSHYLTFSRGMMGYLPILYPM